jgi:hypothetical protein
VDLYDGAAGSGTIKSVKDREPFPDTTIGLPFGYIGSPYEVVIQVKPASDITVDAAESETDAKIHGMQQERAG